MCDWLLQDSTKDPTTKITKTKIYKDKDSDNSRVQISFINSTLLSRNSQLGEINQKYYYYYYFTADRKRANIL